MSDLTPVTLKVRGRAIAGTRDGSDQPVLPRFLDRGTRAVDAADDRFLPRDYVRVVAALDLSAVRAADREPKSVESRPGRVVVLELADGVTVVTSPENLKETLERVRPEAVAADGTVDVEGLEDRAHATRGIAGDTVRLVTRFFALDVGGAPDAILDLARRKVIEWATEKGKGKLAEVAELGVSWLGTKALMWAIEERLPRKPGLYRWGATRDDSAGALAPGDAALAVEAAQGPMLVFIHGTGSNTEAGFGDLRTADRDTWRKLEERFGARIYAFEHRTLSESPIENALALAQTLPAKAEVHLVTHSRGGLVGDLLCLAALDGADAALIRDYALDDESLGTADPEERERLRKELTEVYADQREQLDELGKVLARQQLRIGRYVRVAAPARGTRLASSNFDVFLSALLSLIGLVPGLVGQPLYAAFRRVVLEIVKNRTKPQMVPGIEAMLPESPIARLLARATPQASVQLAVIAGDVEGGSVLARLGVLFTDHAFFDGVDNDLVVDTDSMYAGIARAGEARAYFEKGPGINHFRYFRNDDSRKVLRDWLVAREIADVENVRVLPGMTSAGELPGAEQDACDEKRASARTRDLEGTHLPVVVVLPGIMGSHLRVNPSDRVWLDVDDLLLGGMEKIAFGRPGIEAESLFSLYYGDLCEWLSETHRVVRFPYDWRQPLDELADALAAKLTKVLANPERGAAPVRLLAHSMGGLVVRAMIHRHRELWEAVMESDAARFVMLGTPNKGSHAMVETLIGKGSAIRMLARGDVRHSLQELLDFVGGFPGGLQLLPNQTLRDQVAQGGATPGDYFDDATWVKLKEGVRDFWFGDRVAALPTALARGRWLWTADEDRVGQEIPSQLDKVHYVCGIARNTPSGVERQKDGRWKMVGTPKGDGTVTWESGLLDCIPRDHVYYMPAEHGALVSTAAYFESLVKLLEHGQPGALAKDPPKARAIDAEGPVAYDAGPPVHPNPTDLAGAFLGKRTAVDARPRPLPTLTVQVRAMDLRWVTKPILVGHYEQDPIAGAESVIDRNLVNRQLTARHDLGLYAGPLGSATVVLLATTEEERLRGSQRGAVVTGLGPFDGLLGAGQLTEAVKTGVLRYLLQVDDNTHAGASLASEELPLATLLLGHNSSANLRIADSVTALLRGVIEANRTFAQHTGRKLRVAALDIIEVYLDTAITAARELRRVADVLNPRPNLDCRIEVRDLLRTEGARPRLDSSDGSPYWPRMIVTRDESTAKQDSNASEPATALAADLDFVFVGARARIESVKTRRQPGVVERLVASQITDPSYNEEFGRSLFSLVVPQDFKETVRQLDRVVLALDGYTANLPWELMQAEDEPLAKKTSLVRQLVSGEFRRGIRQTSAKRAYVVGNPSYEGFKDTFGTSKDPESLGGAEAEADRVVQLLTRHGFEVPKASIGQDQRAVDVISRLYQHSYRIVHIAAHGIFAKRRADGELRSGVVLSDGFLITAAEIEAMEFVPDLVFLNCCHLGQIDREPAFDKLAYSVSRELIEMGVRAVVAGGWAVDDRASQHFAERFYEELLGRNRAFGDAVFEARKSTFEAFPASNTWGAYQAWGDPAWRFDPKSDPWSDPASDDWRPEAPEELVDRIDRERTEFAMVSQRLLPSDIAACVRRVDTLLAGARSDGWFDFPQVCVALGRFYAELGPEFFAKACGQYERAFAAKDAEWRAPIRVIEQLANLEARTGHAQGNAALIERAIGRLLDLCGIENAAKPPKNGQYPALNGERAALLGGAYKRLAAVYAQQLTAGNPQAKQPMRSALDWSRYFYAPKRRNAAQKPDPYNDPNWLALQALKVGTKEAAAMAPWAVRCAESADEAFRETPNFWDGVGRADARVAEWILDGQLATRGGTHVDVLTQSYANIFATMAVKPRERDSVTQQIRLLAVLFRAQGRPRSVAIAENLDALLDRLEVVA